MKPRLRRGSGALRAPDIGFSSDFIDFPYIFHIFLGIPGIQPPTKLMPPMELLPPTFIQSFTVIVFFFTMVPHMRDLGTIPPPIGS